MKKSLLGVVVALAIVGGATALLRPIDVDFRIGRGAAPITGNLSVSPSEAQAQTAEEGLESLRSQSRAFVKISKTVLPSVVSIVSEREVRMTGIPGHEGLGGDFFGRFFEMPQRVPQQGSGSGVIVSADGYILTNNHVVAEAERITVTFHDGRALPGKLVGRDPQSDIAVIRVEAKDLTPARIGDSSKLEVGEWVLAVGNPFQLKSTVTAGIVSAVGRSNIGLADYEDFIQTDAAINPGNSGGPLFNMEGKVIGINTAIVAQGQGIGFAIPINMAKSILADLKTKGKVTRGWLGISVQDITDDIAANLNHKSKQGALVSDVFKDDPADKAGIKVGDIITEINGKTVKDTHDLLLTIAGLKVGQKMNLKVIRDGKEMTFQVTVAERKENAAASSEKSSRFQFGIAAQDITPDMAKTLGIAREGVIVADVQPGSPADEVGIQTQDVIVQVNRVKIRSLKDYTREISKAAEKKSAALLIKRGRSQFFVVLKLQ